ncbi:MAG: helix-turn-helix domain-containing protein [Myxococcales bacterium]|nr:helix-turn-helix domain-containing protein [Myxococcales bacterium]MCB9576677.1 helix-turn-helix domain-containing protein [Polyangiaceae bacterium]
MKHLVLTLDRQAALRVIEGARPLAVGGAAEMLDALIASWSGTTDETWFILRDLALRPPEVDPLADIPSPAGLPPEAQSEIGRKTLRALRTVVRQRALHLARKLAPPPTRPVTQLRGRAREHRARSSPRARAAPSAAAADADPEPPPSPPPSRLLTTREAAAYCGFKSTSALRKAKHEGRISPAGRRGGRGTLMWDLAELDRFLEGRAPGTIAADRPGAPSEGDAHGQLDTSLEQLGRPNAGTRRLETKERRTSRASPSGGSRNGSHERDPQGAAGGGSGGGLQVALGRAGPRAGRPHHSGGTEDALRRLRGVRAGAQGPAGASKKPKKR